MKNLYRPFVAGAACLIGTAAASAQQSFQTTTYNIGQNPQATVVEDLNRDGWIDFATTSESPEKISVLYSNDGAGYLPPVQVALSAGVLPTAIAAGDLDGDFDTDLVVGQRGNNSVLIVLNQSGTYVPTTTWQVGADPREMKIADLDNDQDLDIVIANRGSDSVSIVRNMGGLNFSVTGYPCGISPREIEVAELTGDAQLDIAVAAFGSQAIHILRNVGQAAYTTHTTLSTAPQSPEGLTVARLDNNATRDIAVSASSAQPQQAWVFVGDGVGGFSPAGQFALGGAGAKSMVAADFDLDGDRDLATANSQTDTVSVIWNSGSASFGAPQQTPVSPNPIEVVLADFDFNGGADLVTTGQASNSVTLAANSVGGCATQTYCQGSQNSLGRVAQISSSGIPSFQAQSFAVHVTNAMPNASSNLYYRLSLIHI